jgi:RecA-family ATPase
LAAEPPGITEDDFPQGATKDRPAKPKKPNGELPQQEIPKGESVFSLIERDIPDPVRLCDPWATEGLCIIAGRPKLGKTTLMRQKLAAAAAGGKFLDSEFTKPVLCAFLSLEEGQLLSRLKFKQANFTDDAISGIQIFFSWERGREGTDMLDRYLTENPDVQYVVIDSLSRFRQIPDARTPAFTSDYEAVNMLHECAKLHAGVCIDIVHHTRKAKGDDPLDDISGTYGLTAAVDTCVVLRHHSEGASMFITGRLWARSDDTYLLKRDSGQWEMIGVSMGLSEEQIQTIDIIKASAGGLSGTALGEKLNITTQSAWQRIEILIEKGFLVKRHGRACIKGTVP